MIIKPNIFTTYELSEYEQVAGRILTASQKALLQNDLSDYSIVKVGLSIKSNDTQDLRNYIIEHSKLSGVIDFIQSLLLLSDRAEQELAAIKASEGHINKEGNFDAHINDNNINQPSMYDIFKK